MKWKTYKGRSHRPWASFKPSHTIIIPIAQEAQKHHQKFQTKQKYFVNLVNIFLITLFQIKSIAFIFSWANHIWTQQSHKHIRNLCPTGHLFLSSCFYWNELLTSNFYDNGAQIAKKIHQMVVFLSDCLYVQRFQILLWHGKRTWTTTLPTSWAISANKRSNKGFARSMEMTKKTKELLLSPLECFFLQNR